MRERCDPLLGECAEEKGDWPLLTSREAAVGVSCPAATVGRRTTEFEEKAPAARATEEGPHVRGACGLEIDAGTLERVMRRALGLPVRSEWTITKPIPSPRGTCSRTQTATSSSSDSTALQTPLTLWSGRSRGLTPQCHRLRAFDWQATYSQQLGFWQVGNGSGLRDLNRRDRLRPEVVSKLLNLVHAGVRNPALRQLSQP